MIRFRQFEASLLGMLVDKCNADRECLAKLVGLKDLHGRLLVERVVEMKLVSEKRLARLISQYWELPLVNVAFPYRHFLAHVGRPIRDLLEHDLLPLDLGADEFTVVGYYVPSEETVEALENARNARLKLYIAEMSPVKEALLRLVDEAAKFEAAQSSAPAPLREAESVEGVDCGEDKALFYHVAGDGRPALVRERFAGGTVLIRFDRDRLLTKTMESLDPSEPDAVRKLLLGKSMSAIVPPGADLAKLVGDFRDSVGQFEGDLADAILKLRVAQMMFEGDDKP